MMPRRKYTTATTMTMNVAANRCVVHLLRNPTLLALFLSLALLLAGCTGRDSGSHGVPIGEDPAPTLEEENTTRLVVNAGVKDTAGWRMTFREGASQCMMSFDAHGYQPYLRFVLLVGLETHQGSQRGYFMGPQGNTLYPPSYHAHASAAGEGIEYSTSDPTEWSRNSSLPVKAPDGERISSIVIALRDLGDEQADVPSWVHVQCGDEKPAQTHIAETVTWFDASGDGAAMSVSAGGAPSRTGMSIQALVETETDQSGFLGISMQGDTLTMRGSAGTIDVWWPGGEDHWRFLPSQTLLEDSAGIVDHGWRGYTGGAGTYRVELNTMELNPTARIDGVWMEFTSEGSPLVP